MHIPKQGIVAYVNVLPTEWPVRAILERTGHESTAPGNIFPMV